MADAQHHDPVEEFERELLIDRIVLGDQQTSAEQGGYVAFALRRRFRLAATDRSVLRAAVAELMARPGTPVRVVLDEAIELARRYGSAESGGFVNGVLDQVARHLRPEEL